MSERQLIERQQEAERLRQEALPLPPATIAGIDPGKMRDGFALAAIQTDRKNIYIVGAAEWLHKDYTDVEQEIYQIHKTIAKKPFDHIGVEVNNSGPQVFESLRNMGLPVMAINTVGKVTDPKKLRLGNSMVKNDMVHWLKRMIQDDKLFFPDIDSPGTLKLKHQLPQFSRKITEAGNLSYSAQGSEHDDLVMALLIACYIARRRYIRGGGEFAMASANYNFKKKFTSAQDYFPEADNIAGGYAKMVNISSYGPS